MLQSNFDKNILTLDKFKVFIMFYVFVYDEH